MSGDPQPGLRSPTARCAARAYEAELAAWERVAVPLAAALNSIKGEVNTLSRAARLGHPRSTRRCSTTTSTARRWTP